MTDTKRKNLSQIQMYKFIQWVDANKQLITAKRWSFAEVAREATASLGQELSCTFTDVNARRAAAVLGFNWSRRHPARSRPESRSLLRKEAKVLAEAIQKLSQDLGAKLPEEFAELCGTLEG